MNPLAVYCADIGSIKSDNFGWARETDKGRSSSSPDIAYLVASLAADLNAHVRVALGFECPLYVPICDDPYDLTSQRPVDGGRPWSASAGAAVLATGLTETVWILQELRKLVDSPPAAFLSWEEFCKAKEGLFLWEAMVTSHAKGASHREDAKIAVRAFRGQTSQAEALHRSEAGSVYSLIGAALLRTGWSDDLSLLDTACWVIRA